MKATLMKHQSDAVSFALANKGLGAFYHEVGCGKTISALATFEAFREKEPELRMLVICPISLIHGAWIKEIERFTDFNWGDLHSQKARLRRGMLTEKTRSDIYLINFESLLVQKRMDGLIELLNSLPFMVVIDESSKMKNHQAATTEKLIGLWKKGKYYPGIKDLCKYRIIMSGTPAPNIEWEYWAQMNFLNNNVFPGHAGINFYAFRNTYFQMQRGREVIRGAVLNKHALKEMFENGYKYEFDETKRDQFFNSLKPWCHMIKAKDCLDLPDSIDEFRTIEMKDEQLRVYKEMKNEYIAEIKREEQKESIQRCAMGDDEILALKDEERIPLHVVVANIVLTKMMKLRQITSGFAIDEEDCAREIDPKSNPKINALMEIVEECGDQQIIVWGQFKWEIKKIVESLRKIGGVSELHGGIVQAERINHVNDFLSGKNRFLVAHPKSAAHGLTFVNCHLMVFFSYSYSYEDYGQQRGRIMRHGQGTNCVYFHIVAENSVDEDILAVCQKKFDKQEVAARFLSESIF